MCGVFGIFGFDRHHITPDKLREIGQGILFRGPDNHGQFLDKRVAIGFQRLSIIDSDGGNQPIYNEDKTLVMFCNGEIYNYANLREKLILRGHNFRTASDSEVIVHLYEEYGLDCVEHLNGMFAFVIYDTEQNTLWLVRDRLGIKPLYYFVNNENFVFGSSIDSIIEFIGKQPVSRESIYSYLLTSYIPAPMTIYENIKKVMPGEHVLVSLGGVKLERYWIPDGDDEQTEDISEINSRLMTLVMDSVNLESNVNKDIGLSLSGGLDSSMIAVLAKKNKKIESLKTYTIDFYGKNGTDAVASQTVAQFVGTQHKTTRICVVEQLASLSQLIRMLDEPMADSALIPTYLVAKQAKADGLNVMLSGAGSDEIFAGYARHDIDAFLSPAWISTLPKCILLGFCKAIALFDRNKAFRISSPSNNFAMSISGVDVELLSEIIKDDKFIKKADRYFRRTFPANRKTSLHDLLLLDVLNYLPNNILPRFWITEWSSWH
jgi:asparagine synthase (glutamine-hydrolysing)